MRLYLGKYDTKKNYQPKKLNPDNKIIVLKFHMDTPITLAATTGCAKYIFRSFKFKLFFKLYAFLQGIQWTKLHVKVALNKS